MAHETGGKRGAAKRAPRGRAGEADARREVIETAAAMSRQGLSPGRLGNVSTRFEDGILITPSGRAYDAIMPADIVRVQLDGNVPPGQRKPSSELQFHLAAYRVRPGIGAIVEVAHQIINTGTTTMRYLALSTLVDVETCEYPDSQKISVVTGQRGERGLRKMFRAEATVDYYDREKP